MAFEKINPTSQVQQIFSLKVVTELVAYKNTVKACDGITYEVCS